MSRSQAVIEGVRVPFDVETDDSGDGYLHTYSCRLCDYAFTQFEQAFETWPIGDEMPMETRSTKRYRNIKRHLELGHPDWREHV